MFWDYIVGPRLQYRARALPLGSEEGWWVATARLASYVLRATTSYDGGGGIMADCQDANGFIGSCMGRWDDGARAADAKHALVVARLSLPLISIYMICVLH